MISVAPRGSASVPHRNAARNNMAIVILAMRATAVASISGFCPAGGATGFSCLSAANALGFNFLFKDFSYSADLYSNAFMYILNAPSFEEKDPYLPTEAMF